MNCSEANNLDLVELITKHNYFPVKENKNEDWYLIPFRNESKPSFKYDIEKNIWFEFGSGKGSNVLDFILSYDRCDLREALSVLSKEFDSFYFQQQKGLYHEEKNCDQIRSAGLIKHLALKNYLESRKINIDLAGKYCKEIHYSNNSNSLSSEKDVLLKNKKMPFFAIGFENDVGNTLAPNKFGVIF